MIDDIDPRTATPCRTIAFDSTGKILAEANYLGFLTLRCATTGEIQSRFLGQTALVETIRFDQHTGNLLIVGAGFEGYRDFGAVKILHVPSGDRVGELIGHTDDITDIAVLSGSPHRVVSIGLDHKVIVHDLSDSTKNWTWAEYNDYLNMCSPRPQYDGQFAIAGDSSYTYVLSANEKEIIAKIETLGDSNGLIWSQDGRYLLVGDDHSELKYFDSERDWELVKTVKLGGAIKKTVNDPLFPNRGLCACYDGQIWSFSLTPDETAEPPYVVVPRIKGMWGINIHATQNRIAVPSFYDRGFLFERNDKGIASPHTIGTAPRPTYGANCIAVSSEIPFIAITHDDGFFRLRDKKTGELLCKIGGDSESLFMGASFHPSKPLLATIDFYGEIWMYNFETGLLIAHKKLPFGPGISVSFSECGKYLATGGYRWDAYVLNLDEHALSLSEFQLLEKPNQGVIKSVFFTRNNMIVTAAGDGTAVVHENNNGKWMPTHHLESTPPMELCNDVTFCPNSNLIYVVSRDQALRAFDHQTGENVANGYAHTRSVKTVDVSEDGRLVVTGSYDRTVLIWDSQTLKPILPPIRFANSGISSVKFDGDVIFACSFDGVVACIDAKNGQIRWSKNSYDCRHEESQIN